MNNEQLTMNNNPVIKSIIRKTHVIPFFFFIAFFVSVSGCRSPFEMPGHETVNEENALVRIYVGENNTWSRTIQPGRDAIEGYRLSFEPSTINSVDITNGVNFAEVDLAGGNWTITAKAYRLGGTIGNYDDEIASGFVTADFSGGVLEGTTLTIVLHPSSGGEGTLCYSIDFDSAVSGYMKLWEINGFSPVNAFGTGGELTLSGSIDEQDFTLAAGRYITEIKLINGSGNIAFLRDVVEIWKDTVTDLVFTPSVFVESGSLLANSEAKLSEIDTKVNGIAIGAGTGSGTGEDDPRIYIFRTANPGTVSFTLVFEITSLYAAVSWANNTGGLPNGEYTTGALPTDFSVNNILWVKAVSEDGSTTSYYKFEVLPPPPPSNGSFKDTDYSAGRIGGTISWDVPMNYVSSIYGYNIYYGSNEKNKLLPVPSYQIGNPLAENQVVTENTLLPTGAAYFLIYSRNATGEYPEFLAIPLIDLIAISAGGDFDVTGSNPSGVSWESPFLTITQSGTYYITGKTLETTDRIRVMGSGIIANIVITNVNINVGSIADAVALDTNAENDENVIVNLTIEGTNNLLSGDNRAGLRVPSNGSLAIDGNGSISATGGSNGAGIGGNNNESTGSITINKGTINATGSSSGTTGIGSRNDSYSTLQINGGTITATGTIGSGIGIGFSKGTINIEGGTVTVTGGTGGGIGTTNGGDGGFGINGDVINIKGGTVSVTGGSGGRGNNYNIAGGGGHGINSNILNIEGGTITVKGGNYGSGSSYSRDWGGYGINSGMISIKGSTISATGGGYGGNGINSDMISIESSIVTAIGAYREYVNSTGNAIGINGGTISIKSSIITAIYNDVGNGTNGYGINGNLAVQDNSVIFARSIRATLTEGDNIHNSIVFIGNDGIIYGNVTLGMDTTFAADQVLTVSSGKHLTIPGTVTLTNNGTIFFFDSGIITGNVSGNQPIHSNFVISNGSSYTYTGGVLTITGDGTYTINMRSGVSNITMERIVVNSGINTNIALSGVKIDRSSNDGISAFDMTGATVNLTLVGENILRSGNNRAGLQVPGGATLVITENSTGSLAAAGGSNAAGIGGGSGSAGGIISINGGIVTATGGSNAAGIGGGSGGAGGTINTIGGNAVVFASSIQPELPTGSNLGPAIVFNGNNGTLYGDFTLEQDVTFAAGRILTIPAEGGLTIPSGVTLTNNGTINNSGTITGRENITGSGSINDL